MSVSRHLVDPALSPLLDLFPTVALTDEILPQMRQGGRLPMPAADDVPVSVERRSVSGPEGAPEVGVVIYRPQGDAGPRPCVFHVHGGGYVAGSAYDMEPLHKPMAHALDAVIVSVEYRLAPETVFPGAVEDCYAALHWTVGNAAALGIDPARVGVMGESAGGGLAASLALLARDRGGPALAFQHLIYPMIDDRTCTQPDPHPYVGEFIWTPHNNRYGWRALLGREPGGEDVSPYAAAARAQDLSGLPPTYIGTAALDLFLEEDLEYARRLTRAGVPVELHVYPGAFHGFSLAAGTEVADAATRDSLAALTRALRAPASA